MQKETLGAGSIHPISVISSNMSTWLLEQGAVSLDIPEAFLNDFGGDLKKVSRACDLSTESVEQKSAPVSYGRAILFLSKALGSSSHRRVFNIGRCFNPNLVPGTAKEMNQIDVSFIGEGENLASAKGIISHLATVALGEFTEISILPTKLSFISPGGVIRTRCRLCDATGCVTCSKKGVVAIGVLGVVRTSIRDFSSADSNENKLANYIGLNIDVLAMQRYSLVSHDSLYS